MIEIFKDIRELQKESTSNDVDINTYLQQVRASIGKIFFVEEREFVERKWFKSIYSTKYTLYIYLENITDRDSGVCAVEVISLNRDFFSTYTHKENIILYLKGVYDGYVFTKKLD